MANNDSSKHAHEWIAISIWLGLLVATLFTSYYILSSINLPGQIMAQSAQSFGQANQLTGEDAWSGLAKGVLAANALLFLGMVYFMASAWLKLGSVLLEVVIHYSRDSHTESVFATMLYLSDMSEDSSKFDPDEAVGSMPGEVARNLAYAWVATFLIYGLSLSMLYIL